MYKVRASIGLQIEKDIVKASLIQNYLLHMKQAFTKQNNTFIQYSVSVVVLGVLN